MELWFILALIAPALFAIIVLFDDNLLRSVYRSAYFGAIVSGFFALLSLFALPFIDVTIPSPSLVIFGLSSGFLTVIYYFFYFKGLEVEDPSIVIALFSLTPAIIPFLAFIFLDEQLSLNQYVGLAIIIFSSFALSSVDVKKFKISPALIFIGIAAVIFAVISVMQKHVYNSVDFWTGYMLFVLGMGLGSIFLSTSTKKGRTFYKEFKKTLKKWLPIFILVEVLGIAAEFAMNLAISQGPVSVIRVMEGIMPVYILILAIVLFPFFPRFFREAAAGDKLKKFLLMFLMVIGIFIIYKN